DVLIVDTAGRLHTSDGLMEELRKVGRVVTKRLPDAPHETLLVLDGTTGQNGVSQAAAFLEAVQVTGMIVTKLDGTAKGGVILSIMRQFDIPVKFVGVGEGADDLIPFDPNAYVDTLFAM
ncbi:MAG TPA: signal recognition particle-docking protein FtsY, partial [Thermoanaerobaculia bacterium]|nr:signal recognition particle-docking protein FtsY [Thermoanaerobaculia bacterium]